MDIKFGHQSLKKRALRLVILFVVLTLILLFVVTQPVSVNRNVQPAKADSKTLEKTVYYLSDDIFNNTAKVDVLSVKADYIFDQFSQYKHKVSRQQYDVMGDVYENITLNIKGDNEDCGTYIIGAHYDTYANLPGADDNGSGVAGLLELARLFSQVSPVCDLQLVAFTLEEPPYFRSEHMGSYVHAHYLNANKVNVQMMISLEMIGYFDDEQGSQDYPIDGLGHIYSQKGDFISIVGNLAQVEISRFLKKAMLESSDLMVHSINMPEVVQGVDFSDHLNYWLFDFPAVMITDTAFFRNKHYHTLQDTAEKLDYHRMAKVVDGVFYAVLSHMKR